MSAAAVPVWQSQRHIESVDMIPKTGHRFGKYIGTIRAIVAQMISSVSYMLRLWKRRSCSESLFSTWLLPQATRTGLQADHDRGLVSWSRMLLFVGKTSNKGVVVKRVSSICAISLALTLAFATHASASDLEEGKQTGTIATQAMPQTADLVEELAEEAVEEISLQMHAEAPLALSVPIV